MKKRVSVHVEVGENLGCLLAVAAVSAAIIIACMV